MDSTNSFAKQLNEDNVLVLTDHQKKGRGRLDRTWRSDSGLNLTFTIKKHFDVPYKHIQSVNFYACLCVTLALKKFVSENSELAEEVVSIKWPNDILVNGKKISGMLVENSILKNDFVIGIGINVNQTVFPDDITQKAVSLKQITGKDVDLTNLLLEVVFSFDKNMFMIESQSFDEIFRKWKENTDLIGKKVTFSTIGNVERHAQIIDFTEDGGIKLRTEDKDIVYYSGDIKIEEISSK